MLRLAINEWLPKCLVPGNFSPEKPMKTYPRTCSLHSVDLKTSLNFIIPSRSKVFSVRLIFIRLWLLLRVEERSLQQREVKPQCSNPSLWILQFGCLKASNRNFTPSSCKSLFPRSRLCKFGLFKIAEARSRQHALVRTQPINSRSWRLQLGCRKASHRSFTPSSCRQFDPRSRCISAGERLREIHCWVKWNGSASACGKDNVRKDGITGLLLRFIHLWRGF